MLDACESTHTRRIKMAHIGKIWRTVLLPYLDYVAEDAIIDENSGLFAILDGHGGNDVS